MFYNEAILTTGMTVTFSFSISAIFVMVSLSSGPRVHKAFLDHDQAQVKYSFTMDSFFKTYYMYNYLTIDCWYLIRNVLQTRLLGILSFFL